ncbi:GNAT family N-acetyltransferase [Parvibaculum sp.]|jgi:predicted N-acetyltransferase YhbS|uniref:GNAT family N-acetyltransferase n=1 Tax=Parvibaculum sp. TaxID=2024848 RepID=UPI002FDA49AD
MQIRTARPEDAAAIAQLSRELAEHLSDPDPGADDALLLELGFGGERWFECLVAETEKEIVGYALYCRRFEAHTRARKIYLADLAVAKRRRGEGVGEKLIQALHEKAAELGCIAIVLDLWVENATARAFYEKIGAKHDTELEIHAIRIGED